MAYIDTDDTNFDQLIGENDKVVVKFYAEWCGSCRMFKPKYKKLSENEAFNGVKFLYVNANESPEARKKAKVDNLPYFAIYKDGQLVEGSAMTKEESVIELIQKL